MEIKVTGKYPVNIELEGVSFNIFTIPDAKGIILHFSLTEAQAMELRNKLGSAVGNNFYPPRGEQGKFFSPKDVTIQKIRNNPQLLSAARPLEPKPIVPNYMQPYTPTGSGTWNE